MGFLNFFLFCLIFVSTLFILDIKSLSYVLDASVLSHSVNFLLVWAHVSFTMQKSLIWWSSICLFLFCCFPVISDYWRWLWASNLGNFYLYFHTGDMTEWWYDRAIHSKYRLTNKHWKHEIQTATTELHNVPIKVTGDRWWWSMGTPVEGIDDVGEFGVEIGYAKTQL